MRALIFALIGSLCAVLAPSAMAASATMSAMAMGHHAHDAVTSMVGLNMLELPFLAVAIFYSFRTAGALRGGIFGRGMKLMAWGMLVMAVGHLLMMIDMYFGFNLLDTILGGVAGSIVWVGALVLTWGLLGIGFHSIYAASKS